MERSRDTWFQPFDLLCVRSLWAERSSPVGKNSANTSTITSESRYRISTFLVWLRNRIAVSITILIRFNLEHLAWFLSIPLKARFIFMTLCDTYSWKVSCRLFRVLFWGSKVRQWQFSATDRIFLSAYCILILDELVSDGLSLLFWQVVIDIDLEGVTVITNDVHLVSFLIWAFVRIVMLEQSL